MTWKTTSPSSAEEVAIQILEAFDGGDWYLAIEIWKGAELTTDERVACWGFFSDPKYRAWLKQEDRAYIVEYLR